MSFKAKVFPVFGLRSHVPFPLVNIVFFTKIIVSDGPFEICIIDIYAKYAN